MRPPFPTAIVPLLPEFLVARRRTVDFLQRATDRYGVDRPALMFAVNRELTGDWHTLDETRSPYATTNEPLLAAAEAARGAKLVTEWLGRWALTDRGRAFCADFRLAAHAALAKLEPVPLADLARLGELLEQAFVAVATAPEPARRDFLPRTFRFRGGVPAPHAMVALENAIHGLWTVRDDCHVAAWRAAGLDGPALDALTRLWRGEATTVGELQKQLAAQRPADVILSLDRLRTAGLVAPRDELAVPGGSGDAARSEPAAPAGPGDAVRLSDEGRRVRDAIEAETDRLFFAPWPAEVAARSAWIRETLATVNAALAG